MLPSLRVGIQLPFTDSRRQTPQLPWRWQRCCVRERRRCLQLLLTRRKNGTSFNKDTRLSMRFRVFRTPSIRVSKMRHSAPRFACNSCSANLFITSSSFKYFLDWSFSTSLRFSQKVLSHALLVIFLFLFLFSCICLCRDPACSQAWSNWPHMQYPVCTNERTPPLTSRCSLFSLVRMHSSRHSERTVCRQSPHQTQPTRKHAVGQRANCAPHGGRLKWLAMCAVVTQGCWRSSTEGFSSCSRVPLINTPRSQPEVGKTLCKVQSTCGAFKMLNSRLSVVNLFNSLHRRSNAVG
jgi:hypothetical protein